MFSNNSHRIATLFPLLGIAIVAIIAGLLVPVYVNILGDNYARLLILPIFLILLFTLAYSRIALLLLVLFFRGAVDEALGASRLPLGGLEIGAGGIINAFIIFIALLLIVERPQIFRKQIIVMWGAFLTVCMITILWSPAKGDAVRLYLAFVSNFAIFVSAFYFVRKKEDFKSCIEVVVWSSLIPLLYGFFQFATGVGIPDGRVRSTFPHANVYAFYLNLVVSLLLYMLKSPTFAMTIYKRWFCSALMLGLLTQLALTQTRSAWLACFVMFGLYGLIFERKYLIHMVIFPLIALTIPDVQDRLLDLNKGNEVIQYAKLNSFAWRQYIWESSLAWMNPERYFLGYGLDSFQVFSNTFFPLAGNSSPGAHNVYIQLFFETGLVGLLAFLWMFWQLFSMLKPVRHIDKLAAFTVSILIAEYLIVAASDNMLYYLPFNWYFWFILGGAFGVVTIFTQNSIDRHNIGNEWRTNNI